MTLCCQVVYLRRAHLAHYLLHAHRIVHVAIVQVKVRTPLEVGNAFAKVHRRAADDAVHLVALF